jgi:hypothetical protein
MIAANHEISLTAGSGDKTEDSSSGAEGSRKQHRRNRRRNGSKSSDRAPLSVSNEPIGEGQKGEAGLALVPDGQPDLKESEPQGSKFPPKVVEVNPIAVYEGAVYYSESKLGHWQMATPEQCKALQRGDRVAIANQNWVYSFVRWEGDEALVQFIGYNFRTRIESQKLQVPYVAELEPVQEDPSPESQPFYEGDRVAPNWKAGRGKRGTVLKAFTKGKKNPVWWCDVQWAGQRREDGSSTTVRADQLLLVERATNQDGAIATTPPSTIAPHPQSLTQLAAEINELYGQAEESAETQQKIEESILELRKLCGQKLLEAKERVVEELGWGKWEDWRQANIKDPRTGKPMPSSTATFCQRAWEKREEMEGAGITTVRAAVDFLKKPRISATNGGDVAELPEGFKDECYSRLETLINPVTRVLGRIDLDPFSSVLANETVGAEVFFDKEKDGLKQEWRIPGREQITVWDNCGFSWPLVEKAGDRHIEAWESGLIEASIAIRNNATETSWFQKLAQACTVRLDLNTREQFDNPYVSYRDRNRQGQVLFYFGHQPEKFYREFEGRGVFYPPAPVEPVAITPEICTPSITPEEFNREMQASTRFTGCHNCKYRILTGGGDRYWCDQGEFDDTLLLKQNWMEMNEGCKSFIDTKTATNTTAAPATQVTVTTPAIVTPPAVHADTRPGIQAVQKLVWEWLNSHGIEVDENTANAAADSIYEFLQGQFLEVYDAE